MLTPSPGPSQWGPLTAQPGALLGPGRGLAWLRPNPRPALPPAERSRHTFTLCESGPPAGLHIKNRAAGQWENRAAGQRKIGRRASRKYMKNVGKIVSSCQGKSKHVGGTRGKEVRKFRENVGKTSGEMTGKCRETGLTISSTTGLNTPSTIGLNIPSGNGLNIPSACRALTPYFHLMLVRALCRASHPTDPSARPQTGIYRNIFFIFFYFLIFVYF